MDKPDALAADPQDPLTNLQDQKELMAEQMTAEKGKIGCGQQIIVDQNIESPIDIQPAFKCDFRGTQPNQDQQLLITPVKEDQQIQRGIDGASAQVQSSNI